MQKAVERSATAFSLGPQNDTSITLDLLRAIAAQMVCVGHAINFSGAGYTFIPHIGVMLFFVLSGFVIAHTLVTKSADPRYDIRAYGIERFSRIYCAYVPALILIAIADNLMAVHGRPIATEADARWSVWIKNLFMLQGHPSGWGAPTYGSAGHLTSLAAEFHIYFFVGGLYFLLLGRSRAASTLLALVASKMALGYFIAIPDSDRALFVVWLLGFGAYFICRSVAVDAKLTRIASIAAPLLVIYWIVKRVPGQEYNIGNYPVFVLAFLSVALAAQGSRWIISHDRQQSTVRFLADYSYSLFLTHMAVVKVALVLVPGPRVVAALAGVAASNVVAVGFAWVFERHYRRVADTLKRALLR